MKRIFVDANIYLNFFDSNKPEPKKLLDSLLEVKDNLFANSQIVCEVNRNKLGTAQKSFFNHFSNLSSVKPISLPEHLEAESTELRTWNSQSKEISKKQKELQKGLEELIHKTLEEIMCSADRVSQTFGLLFEDAVEASEQEIQMARHRREIGNPPGKPNDPLGDQISWEQFLNCSSGADKIWIITKDSDYCTTFQNRKYLNSFLYGELVGSPSVFCFESLAEGLSHFDKNSLERINKLPTEDELRVIAEEELSDAESRAQSQRFFPVVEQGKLTYMYLPPGFMTPNHYIQYLRAFDSEER